MKSAPNALPAYAARRKSLLDQLAQVEARASMQQIELALFVTDVCVATLHDLLEANKLNSAELHRQSRDFDSAASEALGQATPDIDDGDPEVVRFLAILGLVRGQAASNIFTTQLLRAELLQAMGQMWIELLRDLYNSDNRRLFFDRLEKLFDFASTKLPVVGDILEILKTAAETYALRKLQAKEADKYLLSLESYVDAANIYLIGVLGFCELVHRLTAGQRPPTDDEVQERVALHIKSISEGTHATSARADA